MAAKSLSIIALVLLMTSCANELRSRDKSGSSNREFARVEKKDIDYQEFAFNDLYSGAKKTFGNLAFGKKLVMVVYFAPWCHNWLHEMSLVERLYNKYKDAGFGVIAINEYGPSSETRALFGAPGAPYPVVIESESKNDRTSTTHFAYRRLADDQRLWGSPWHIFIDQNNESWVVNGELIESDIEPFIESKLHG